MGFTNHLINGISLGSAYTVIALGYTMIYGIAKTLSFAHGGVIMAGSYVVFVTADATGLPPTAGALLAMAVYTLLGMTIERIVRKPLRGASPLAVLITAIDVSHLLQNVALLISGADTKSSASVVTLPVIKLTGEEMTITGETVATILSRVIIMIRLTIFISKSKAGQAILVVPEDRGAATLMGININGTIALTFAIDSAPAVIAGVLLCSAYPSPIPYTGSMLGIKAFVAAVFGGTGSIPGTFTDGILLGVIEILSKTHISSQMSDATMFSVLIIMFPVKPTGTLGRKISEKV